MDAHVTVIETSTGKKLTGEDAPTRKELEKWLSDNPGLVTHTTKHFYYKHFLYIIVRGLIYLYVDMRKLTVKKRLPLKQIVMGFVSLYIFLVGTNILCATGFFVLL